jgi:predicted SprT family Zn-dependent metalloprotease
LTKTQQVLRVKESTKFSFIESLSIQVEDESMRDPAVLPYMKKFKNRQVKNDLLRECFNKLNEGVFDNRLPEDMKLTWSSRLTATGGFCKNNLRLNTSEIQVSTKVCDTPERMRDVLAHEMCHAAAFLLDQVLDGHGAYWRAWANKVSFYTQRPRILFETFIP